MEYELRYVGGPADGAWEPSPSGERFQVIRLKPGSAQVWETPGIYEYDRTERLPEKVVRVYRFVRRLQPGEAVDDIGGNDWRTD